jgi:hypothetical protein
VDAADTVRRDVRVSRTVFRSWPGASVEPCADVQSRVDFCPDCARERDRRLQEARAESEQDFRLISWVLAGFGIAVVLAMSLRGLFGF